MITLENQVIQAISQIRNIQNQLPYDELGSCLAEISEDVFRSADLSYQTYPIELYTEYPPFWGSDEEREIIPRRVAVKASADYLKKNPTLFISSDGGLLPLNQFTLRANIIRISAVFHAPFVITKKSVQIKSFYRELSKFTTLRPDVEMAMSELQVLSCSILHINGAHVRCGQFGCPKGITCPLKKFDFEQFSSIPKIVGFLDRPICALYLQRTQNVNLIKTYRNLLEIAKKYNIPLISVTPSSQHHSILDLIVDQLESDVLMQPANSIYGVIENWIKEHKSEISASKIPKRLRSRYNLETVDDLIQFLFDFKRQREFAYRFIDFTIMKHLLNGFEYRTPGFHLNNNFLNTEFPNIDFRYVYFSYNQNWARVEFVNTSPQEAARYYLIQSSLHHTFYPFIISLAHNSAYLGGTLRKVLMRLYVKLTGAKPSFKFLSKGGYI